MREVEGREKINWRGEREREVEGREKINRRGERERKREREKER